MALIKNALSETMAREAIVLNLSDIRRQGEELRERARAEAAKIVEDGKAERKRLIADAAAEGKKQGLEEGREQGRREGFEGGAAEAREQVAAALGTIEAAWTRAIEEFERARDDMLIEARTDVVRLATAIGARVTRRIVEVDPAAVLGPLESALSIVTRGSRLVVAVNPDDRADVERALPDLAARLASSAHAEVSPDPSLPRGSCVVRTGKGEIDASVETQIERIVAELVPGRHRANPDEPAPDAGEAAP